MYSDVIQCTFHARLLKVLSQLPDLPERSKPAMLDYSKHQKWVRPVVHDTIQVVGGMASRIL